MVQKINSKEELQKAIQENEVILVKYGAQWCGPCKMLIPVLEAVSENYAVADVDVDELKEVAEEQGIMSVPVLQYYKSGELVKTEIGYRSGDLIEENLSQL